MDQQIIAFADHCPQSCVEHPVGIGAKGEAVLRIVVAAFGVLMDVGGLHDVACCCLEAITSEGAGVFVAGADFGFEAVVAAYFLAGLEGIAVFGEFGHGGAVGNGETEALAEADLLSGCEVGRDHDSPCAEAKIGIHETGKKIGIKMAESGGEFGDRRIPLFIEAFPDGITFASECVEGHGDFGAVFPASDNEVPIIAEAGDKVGIVGHPAVAENVHFDQVHHAENHQWLVRSDTKAGRFRGVQVGEFAKPVGSESRKKLRSRDGTRKKLRSRDGTRKKLRHVKPAARGLGSRDGIAKAQRVELI